MSKFSTFLSRNKIFYLALTAVLFLSVACGSAAAPKSDSSSDAKPATSQTAKQADPATAIPVPIDAPAAESESVSGTVTLMAADWGTQSFEPRDASGQIMTQFRMLHGWLIAGNENTKMIQELPKNGNYPVMVYSGLGLYGMA